MCRYQCSVDVDICKCGRYTKIGPFVLYSFTANDRARPHTNEGIFLTYNCYNSLHNEVRQFIAYRLLCSKQLLNVWTITYHIYIGT